MWTTQKWLPAAQRLMEKLGFRYVFLMVWHKPGGFQPIDLPQYNAEFLVYGLMRFAVVHRHTKDFWVCFQRAAPRAFEEALPNSIGLSLASLVDLASMYLRASATTDLRSMATKSSISRRRCDAVL